MARPKAADHGEKRDAILQRAAELFAREGYHRASLAQLAEAGGVSKSLVYHYYSSKEALLFDVIERHITGLVDAAAAADDPALDPEPRLEALVMALLERYRDADSAHKVQMNDLDHLPPDQQAIIKAEQRELVRRFSKVIGLINPRLVGTEMLRPATMSLFGMLNWHYTWFKDGGPMSRAAYARFATRLFVEGVRKAG
jgi:TetR/AcrR family transcriptional regulator